MLSKGFSTNYDLVKWSQKLNVKIDGIIYKDELYKLPPKYEFFILNLDETGNGGSHWVALYVPKKGDYSYYMDSYGIVPPEAVKDYSKRSKKKDVIYNTKQIQSLRSDFCGQYSLLFLYYMQKEKGSLNKRFENFLKTFEKYNYNLL